MDKYYNVLSLLPLKIPVLPIFPEIESAKV